MGLIRLVVIGFIGLSVVYFAIAIYSRSVRRGGQDNPDSKDKAARDVFIEQGMAEYNAGIRPKLILLVYIIPAISVAVIHILTTY